MKNSKIFYILFLIIVITACSPFGRLYKEQSRVTLALPANRRSEPVEIAKRDSANQPPVLNFTFISAKGDSIPVGMSVEWDSVHQENLTTVALDEVVVSAGSTRNTAERNGLINVEFVVTVPKVLQQENWMVNVRPVLMRGDVPDSLKELRFTGQRFRELQERDYRRYDRYVEKIIPDSANFYRTYVNYRSFECYLERLKWYKRRLEKLWAIQDAKKRRPDPLLLRFEMFNRQVNRRDSLLKEYMLKNSRLMIERQQWQYDRALERVNDTLQPQWSGLRERFRYFNHKWELRTNYQAGELVTRKKYFYDRVSFEPLRQAEHRLYYVRGVDTVPPLWLMTERPDTVQTRQKSLANFSEESIFAYYGLGDGQAGFTRSKLPLYAYHRNLSDSLQLHLPGRKASRELELSRFDSVTTVKHYIHCYESLRSVYPQYHLIRELYNIHPPAVRHAALQEKYGNWIAHINSLDSTDLVKKFYNTQKIARNEARKAMKDEKYHDIVRFPFNPDAELDTVIYAADQVKFLYSQKVPADENSARMKVYVVGNVLSGNGSKYPLPKSDTLTYLVSSMTKFIDKTPRYVRKIIARDAEANTSVNFYFPRNGFNLDETIAVNRKGVKKVKDLTLALMTNPVYKIDSLTLFASSSPEGSWRVNGEIAQKRAKSIRDVLVREFTVLYDSLSVGVNVEMDEAGNLIHREVKDEIPDLPNLMKIRTIPEDWNKLRSLIVSDADFKGHKDAILRIIDREQEPDRREWLIKSQYKSEYAYMLEKLYPIIRAVDFRFSLSRRGMKQDTIYTNEPDTTYARAVEYLEKRKYAQALEMLRPYDDVNTAIAYMSLGYDKAALRIFEKSSQTADNKYMQAILQARLGNEEKAVRLLLGAVDMNAQMKFRANLDPELSELVKKYGLFKEEEDDWN
ncbi:tetratricopeptide repeat protein [Bacteroides fragilis]|uniref:tetratricopeptide repeat protein n=1 Tax=Bacteroides TaxID=816 RepID=UPI002030F3F7|nr:tetratricopeptide repeat protein [Bacteroides fragilis]MCE8588944.1 tetratricopeptide repeat protein [Bacteroides fragilis]MCE8592974.1 tetratricopeptide repeat protein [Bacteroides fragilis]MCE8657603.1 tetratricopeptide repeat protein [Bacteroides fragilis]MCE8660308.1 tetratricopeptide repeat protein [Bacteroides fragilis]MCM0265281.1 tetratricopeptide repeat protein [Bacteroides fragilis]